MAFSIRPAQCADVFGMQQCNLQCLPENYVSKFYFYHLLSWPHCVLIGEDATRQVAGYVLAKMENEGGSEKSKPSGHVTSLSVLRTHRQAGLAKNLMKAAHTAMFETYDGHESSLHVRVSNAGAFSLYCDVLSYKISRVEDKYYADDEDAFLMAKILDTNTSVGPAEKC
eukprot:Blabericola_migrator_1__7112@NODE_35_length_17941_cov_94_946347_g31_i0_p12_GENE_NODE_35_length_17941_cov_94_946347_g31_i0NODE_35_length_17941_cov_94_946347_g31_i0_p12_ORF_typecomplete_len169_score22_12Acetyltransf_1/PF00583_25/3_5e10Acetyltransf_10/PF13673_7/4_7e06FR47/PF08445_10/1_7e05Acetyltransf_9/PF13527_7/1_9e05Acetyltransf_7/PF13508_7/0_00026_NODE_35_length_17941_cov_94_946347_g31_i01471615222